MALLVFVHTYFTFAPMITKAFSQNVGNFFFSDFKLVTENLLSMYLGVNWEPTERANVQVDRGDEEENVQLSFLINLYSLSLTSRDWSQRIIVTNSDKHGPVNWLHSTSKKNSTTIGFLYKPVSEAISEQICTFQKSGGGKGEGSINPHPW